MRQNRAAPPPPPLLLLTQPAAPHPPADTCETSQATQLVGVVSKGSHTWTANRNGVYYLICTVGTVGGGERTCPYRLLACTCALPAA